MDLGLKGKPVIVTGGASGIGRATVGHLLAEGSQVAVVDRNPDALRETQALHPDILPIEADLREPAACKMSVQRTQDAFGGIYGLVNNAGLNDKVGLEEGDPEAFMESIRLNLLHVYAMTHYALPALKASKGAIVNIASKTAVTGQGNTSGYVAAKGGVLGLTREWAADLLPFGIRSNAVLPAETWTPMYEDWVNRFDNPAEELASITAKIPLGRRMTSAAEIAQTIVFLLSDKASHTTGQYMYVDGGYVHLDRALT